MGRRSGSGHRAGPFKQSNKVHKTGRHRSKNQIAVEKKGRVNLASQSGKAKKELSRAVRKLATKHRRGAKLEAASAEKRSLGSGSAPPFLTTIISLTEDVLPELILASLAKAPLDDLSSTRSARSITHLSLGRFKQRFSFLCPHESSLFGQLDALSAADSAVLVWPADGVLSEEAERRLALLNAAGLPATVSVVRGLRDLKKPEAARKALKESLERWSLEAKFFCLDGSGAEAAAFLRHLGNLRRRPNLQRSRRSHLLAERAEVGQAKGGEAELLLYGYLRGPPLDANALVHLSGWGDFQLSRIDLVKDPQPLRARGGEGMEAAEEDAVRLLQEADPKLQESLAAEAEVDEMGGEQTWPSESELAEAAKERRERRRVPKGTSEYQAAWILDDEDEEADASDADEGDSQGDMEAEVERPAEQSEESEEEGEEEEMEDMDMMSTVSSMAPGAEVYDAAFDAEEERRLAERFRAQRENEEFPDEVDTPQHLPARTRFQRYRGLASFRTSPWDPKENLPADYARIFQFANFKATKKRVLAEEASGAQHGWYIRLALKDPSEALLAYVSQKPQAPLLVTRLLRHEARMSLVNVVLRRHGSFGEAPIKSKDPLLLWMGHRRFLVRPLLSTHSNGDKQRLERWLPGSDRAVVASFYAPITFPPSPVLAFTASAGPQLVAVGSLLDLNPNRIVLKRIVLSGHPFKINVRSAVVRHMFFNRDDVLWFKPVELRTKYGKRGHIKEPLGTHGHMKCIFDKKLNSMDTVLLTLYKRVFPKWSYQQLTPLTALPEVPQRKEEDEDEENMES